MNRALSVLLLVMPFAVSEARATYVALDVEAECQSITSAGISDCSCQGRYFEAKFGPEDGTAALHLVGRSYTPQPQVTLASLYERFGAAKLDKAAQRVLETQGEVAVFCPFSPHFTD